MLESSDTFVLILGKSGSFNFSSATFLTLGISFVNFISGFTGPWPVLFNKVLGLVLGNDVIPVAKKFSGCNKILGETLFLSNHCVLRAVELKPSSSSSTDVLLPILR